MTLIFLHIPKAGGSTFNTILKREFDNKNIHHLDYSGVEKFKKNFSQNTPPIDLLMGHFPFGLHESFSEKTKYITFLRSPVSRVISFYNYILDTPTHYRFDMVAKTKMPLSDFAVSTDITSEIDNGQVRFLSARNDRKYTIDENNFEKAKSNLALFFEVGITEKFDRSLVCFHERNVLSKIPIYIKANVARKPKIEIHEDVIKLIEERNKYDIALYEYANKMLENRIEQIPNFENRLAEFKQKNIDYERKYGFLHQIPSKLKSQLKRILHYSGIKN